MSALKVSPNFTITNLPTVRPGYEIKFNPAVHYMYTVPVQDKKC